MSLIPDIRFATTSDEARRAVALGYCPVECSFGGRDPVVDELCLDHHGSLSHLEPVGVRCLRDHHGARADDPRFVVTGGADADACLAIAALLAWVTPDKRMRRVARAVARMDLTPDPIDVDKLPGQVLAAWLELNTYMPRELGFLWGALLWRRIGGHLDDHRWFSDGAVERRKSRYAAAAYQLKYMRRHTPELVSLVGSDGRGADPVVFHIIYQHAPLVVVLSSRARRITVGAKDRAAAEQLLGPGGLKRLWSRMGPGWGGREEVGGSPRDHDADLVDVDRAVAALIELIDEHRANRN